MSSKPPDSPLLEVSRAYRMPPHMLPDAPQSYEIIYSLRLHKLIIPIMARMRLTIRVMSCRFRSQHAEAFNYSERRQAEHPTGHVHRPVQSHEKPAVWAVCVDPV